MNIIIVLLLFPSSLIGGKDEDCEIITSFVHVAMWQFLL